MRLIDAYNIRPMDIQEGDVALFVVKVIMAAPGRYRLYRCPYEQTSYDLRDLPQGSRILYEEEVCRALFPSIAQVAEPG